MARDEEKANSMLHRFREQQRKELGLPALGGGTRPRTTEGCESVAEAVKWRAQIVTEISTNMTRIQDADLVDDEVRDINDRLNRLLREKTRWEYRIRDLNGPDYIKRARMTAKASTGADNDDEITLPEGLEAPGAKGYKYFGRAKELPGVKELFEAGRVNRAEAANDGDKGDVDSLPLGKRAKRKLDILARVDAEYFGYNDNRAVTDVDEPLYRRSDAFLEKMLRENAREQQELLSKKKKAEVEGEGEGEVGTDEGSKDAEKDGSKNPLQAFRYAIYPTIPSQQEYGEYLIKNDTKSKKSKKNNNKSNKNKNNKNRK